MCLAIQSCTREIHGLAHHPGREILAPHRCRGNPTAADRDASLSLSSGSRAKRRQRPKANGSSRTRVSRHWSVANFLTADSANDARSIGRSASSAHPTESGSSWLDGGSFPKHVQRRWDEMLDDRTGSGEGIRNSTAKRKRGLKLWHCHLGATTTNRYRVFAYATRGGA